VTRIIGGAARGRRLAVPAAGTRPTSDRAREGLFNTLAARIGLGGIRFLDLYAGSGAVGLEALSRGAAATVLVESAPRALSALRANIAALALPGATVAAAAVRTHLSGPPPGEPYDAAFADPPYAAPAEEVAALLRALARPGWIGRGGMVVIERSARSPEPEWVEPITGEFCRTYGEASLWYGRRP
jgi:16S rRNA (guanine966-N2)-methyltransferase